MKKIIVIMVVLASIISINQGCSKKRGPSSVVGPLDGTATTAATVQATATRTITRAATATAAVTSTHTRTQAPTVAATRTPTLTQTPLPTNPPATPTVTRTTAAATPTHTQTRTYSPTGTATRTITQVVLSTPTQTRTSTPTAGVTPGLWVGSATILQGVIDMGVFSMAMTDVQVMLSQGSEYGPALIGALADVNGTPLADQGMGQYIYSNSAGIDYAPGTTLNLAINSASGNGAASLTVPPAPGITQPAAGGVVSASAGFDISWSYTGGTPSGVTLMVADSYGTGVVMQYLSGSTTNYNVSAGQMVTGTAMVFLLTQASSPFTGAVPGSADLLYIYEAVNYISVAP